MYTTAVGSLFGFTSRISNAKKVSVIHRNKWVLIVVFTSIMAFFASSFGFSNLVKFLYPVVGYGGILLLVCLGWSRVFGKY